MPLIASGNKCLGPALLNPMLQKDPRIHICAYAILTQPLYALPHSSLTVRPYAIHSVERTIQAGRMWTPTVRLKGNFSRREICARECGATDTRSRWVVSSALPARMFACEISRRVSPMLGAFMRSTAHAPAFGIFHVLTIASSFMWRPMLRASSPPSTRPASSLAMSTTATFWSAMTARLPPSIVTLF